MVKCKFMLKTLTESVKNSIRQFIKRYPIVAGCGMFLFAMFLSVCNSVFVKKTMVQYQLPSWEVIFIRELAICIMLLPFMVRFKFNFFNKKTLKPNAIRNVLYAISTYLLYTLLTKMSVNDVTSFQFFTPVVASIFAMIFLKERGSKIIWLSLLVCVCGGFVIKQPDFNNSSSIYTYILLCLFIGMRSFITILNKKLSMMFSISTIVFYTHIIMFLFSACFAWQFIKPHPTAIVILAFAGLIYCIEYILVYKAYTFCSVLVIQPCEFSKFVYSIILSSLVLGETTTINQIVGAIIIMIGFFISIFDKRQFAKK